MKEENLWKEDGRRRWMKTEKMDEEEDKSKKEISQDNEKSNVF